MYVMQHEMLKCYVNVKHVMTILSCTAGFINFYCKLWWTHQRETK